MSEPDAFTSHEDDNAAQEAGDELQFDQAEYATPAPAGPSCGFCKRPIDDAYHEINGKVICATCRQRVEAAFRGGSGVARVIKALIFGSVAAVAGAVLYYAIVRISGYNIGLVAVVVGFMVGGAVRKGTSNRGGLFYQLLAVFLTYSAIGLMDLSLLIGESLKAAKQENEQAQGVPGKIDRDAGKAKAQPDAPAVAAHDPPARPKADAPPGPSAGTPGRDQAQKPNDKTTTVEGRDKNKHEVAAPAKAAPPPERTLPGLEFILTGLAILYALPVLHAFQYPISGLIYCFALWEAWKINKGVQLVFNGPFRVSTGVSNAPAREDVDDGG